MNIQNFKIKGCQNCTKEYQCFDCECIEMSWFKGYSLQDDLTWKKENQYE